MGMATPPQLTPEQRTAALAKAAEARAARAELKNQLKNVLSRSARLRLDQRHGRKAESRVAARVASLASARSRRARSWKTSASPTTVVYKGLALSKSSHCSINSASEAMAASDGHRRPLIIVISGPAWRRQGNDCQRPRRARPQAVWLRQIVDDPPSTPQRARHGIRLHRSTQSSRNALGKADFSNGRGSSTTTTARRFRISSTDVMWCWDRSRWGGPGQAPP